MLHGLLLGSAKAAGSTEVEAAGEATSSSEAKGTVAVEGCKPKSAAAGAKGKPKSPVAGAQGNGSKPKSAVAEAQGEATSSSEAKGAVAKAQGEATSSSKAKGAMAKAQGAMAEAPITGGRLVLEPRTWTVRCAPEHPEAKWVAQLKFLGPHVFLGGQGAAKDDGWLAACGIRVLINCEPKVSADHMQQGIAEIAWPLSRQLGSSPNEPLQVCYQIATELSQNNHNILFWCHSKGCSLSAAGLAMFLMFHMVLMENRRVQADQCIQEILRLSPGTMPAPQLTAMGDTPG